METRSVSEAALDGSRRVPDVVGRVYYPVPEAGSQIRSSATMGRIGARGLDESREGPGRLNLLSREGDRQALSCVEHPPDPSTSAPTT